MTGGILSDSDVGSQGFSFVPFGYYISKYIQSIFLFYLGQRRRILRRKNLVISWNGNWPKNTFISDQEKERKQKEEEKSDTMDTNWKLHLPMQRNGQESNGIEHQVEYIKNICAEVQVARNQRGTIVTAIWAAGSVSIDF